MTGYWDTKSILVTGVSRPGGIGATIARRLAERGARIAVHGYASYDLAQGYGDAQDDATALFAAALREEGYHVVALMSSDLSQDGAASRVVDEAYEALGPLSDLIVNHAYSTMESFGSWTAPEIQKHMDVNVVASMMMVQRFCECREEGQEGAITLFTSGQYLGPMVSEVAYAVSKEAVRNLTTHLAALLAPRQIRVNCVNPGPTDTGYLSGEAYTQVAHMFPTKRWGTPEDASRLVEFLHAYEGRWIVGQTIGSEGGFQR